ncbi:hypothetical protein F4780DRAFT_778713 [Xylariomycetidae sp. FL0641]|nr:hypothetical protein F4780DRAFT_778713 [Xylariomycetidae sp. FL0641]
MAPRMRSPRFRLGQQLPRGHVRSRSAFTARWSSSSSSSSSTPSGGNNNRTPTGKRIIFTAAFTAVAAVGAIYGAGLKMQQELKEERQEAAQATVAERVAALEAYRAELVAQKRPLEAKLADLRRRMREAEEAVRDHDGKRA